MTNEEMDVINGAADWVLDLIQNGFKTKDRKIELCNGLASMANELKRVGEDSNLIGKEGLIIVEGRADVHVMQRILQGLSLTERWQVKETGGKTKEKIGRRLAGLGQHANWRKVKRILILVDANGDVKESRKVVEQGINFATKRGTRIDPQKRLEIVTLPDNSNNGTLETVLLRTHPDPAISSVVQMFLKIVERHWGRPIKDKEKSAVRAYISVTDGPERSTGVAAANDWNLLGQEFKEIHDAVK